MELCSLHPLDLSVVDRYVRAVAGEADGRSFVAADPAWSERVLAMARGGYERALRGEESGANAVTVGLAQALATTQPSFVQIGMGLTIWEARIDRGIGMLMRPPSRLFIDAGLETAAARTMPIRLDLSRGLMGGAFIPARLVPDLERLLEQRTSRLLRRLAEAELDAVATMGLMMEACAYAREQGLGLFEAMDAITPEAPASDPPGARVVLADLRRLDRALRKQLEEAAKPPKQPGLVTRLFRRSVTGPSIGDNGKTPQR